MKEIIKQRNEFIKQFPQLEEEINDLAQLAIDEIEEGASVQNELQLFISSVEDLDKE